MSGRNGLTFAGLVATVDVEHAVEADEGGAKKLEPVPGVEGVAGQLMH